MARNFSESSIKLIFSFLLTSSALVCIVDADHSTVESSSELPDKFDNNIEPPDLGPQPPEYSIIWKGPLEHDINYDDDDVIRISTKYNESYVCLVPGANDQYYFDTSAKNSSSSSDKSKTEKEKSPIDILEPLLEGNYCSYKFELFWIYELCHGKFLRQYHEENAKHKAKVTQEYYLGRMLPEEVKAHKEEYSRETEELERTGQSRPKILVNGHYKPYVMFNMTGGTKCDLTKENRVSRIIYVCNDEPNLDLYSIKEISTCEYEAIVLSPLLCQHKDFKIDITARHEIRCYSLDGSPKRPKKTIDLEDLTEESQPKDKNRKSSVAYLQGRTLIIDADFLLS